MGAFDLNSRLLELGEKDSQKLGEKDSRMSWTVGNAVEGVQIFGGIGSGKTSGSGRTIALKYLSAGFGGLVLTVKPDECADWEEYCRLTNRTQDLVIVSPRHKNHFNFLEYESTSHKGGEQSLTENLVQVLKTVINAGNDTTIGGDDAFWQVAQDMLMSNAIDLCHLAYGKVTVKDLYDIVQSAPRREQGDEAKGDKVRSDAFSKALKIAHDKIPEWVEEYASTLPEGRVEELKTRGQDAVTQDITENCPNCRTYYFADEFFRRSYRQMPEKTRSIIDFTFSGFLFSLLRDPVYSLFCRYPSTFQPDDCLQGKIIVIDLPVKLYHKVGRDCQILFKYIWQRAMERRGKTRANDRPVFLWADEAQNFLHEYDAQYQATARSSKIATVYISQNIPNYYASMGGQDPQNRVKSFLGTLATKIFHSNADIETNRYASDLIGDGLWEEKGKSVSYGGNMSFGENTTGRIDKIIRPEDLLKLKTGGEKNSSLVEGYVHVQSSLTNKGFNHIKGTFDQNFQP